MMKLLGLSSLFFLLLSCASKYQLVTDAVETNQLPPSLSKVINDLPISHDRPYMVRSIRTHFHFINNEDSTVNFTHEDGLGVVNRLLESANNRMRKNDRMHLPSKNETPVRDSHIRYILADYDGSPAIFYHYQKVPDYFIKKGKKANRYNRSMINEYVVEEGSVLNVLMMPFDPSQLKSGEQKLEQTAIALGSTIKLPGLYQSGQPEWKYAGSFNHEVGHVLGLRHSWNSNDGCDDTPHHDNCWNSNLDPPCDGLTSNNLMDYNAHQSAMTPCQISIMQSNIVNPGHRASRIVAEGDCKKRLEKYIISHHQKWASPIRLFTDLIIKEGAILYVKSLLQIPDEGTIVIEKGGTLILENATLYNFCGLTWGGIQKHPNSHLYFIGENNVLRHTVKNQISSSN